MGSRKTDLRYPLPLSPGLGDQPHLLPVSSEPLVGNTRSVAFLGVHGSAICLAHL